MKYSEFLQLDKILENKGSSVKETFKLNSINEADKNIKSDVTKQQKIETERVKLGWFTRWGKLKIRLNKIGKRHQKKLIENVILKYLPKMLENEVSIAKIILKAVNENKPPNEIKSIALINIQRTKTFQEKQFKIINNITEKYLNNISIHMDKKIDDSKIKDKNKINLKNYWLLLKTQIHMNTINYIENILNTKIKEIIGDNTDASNVLEDIKNEPDSFWSKTFSATKSLFKDREDKYKEEIRAREKEMQTEDIDKIRMGEKYILTDRKNNKYAVEVIKITDDNIIIKDREGSYKKINKKIFNDMYPTLIGQETYISDKEEDEGERETELD